MQVLLISERFPWPLEDGGNLRTFHVLKAISQLHDVTLLCHEPTTQHAQSVKELERYCRVVTVAAPSKLRTLVGIAARPWDWQKSLFVLKNWSSPLYRESRNLIEHSQFDIVHFNHLDTAVFSTKGEWPRSVFDSHNCISEMVEQMSDQQSAGWKRLFYRMESQRLSKSEKTVCENCDVILACSEQDQASFLNIAPTANVEVVPNGVDTEKFGQRIELAPPAQTVPRIVFTGAMDYQPNVVAVDWFCKFVFPMVRKQIPNILYQIVGRSPKESVQRWHDLQELEAAQGCDEFSANEKVGIEVTGRVESVVRYLNQASIVVVPLLNGGGTRLKILEAFAANKAVVSTTKGAEGIEAKPDKEILIANEPQAFANAIIRLIRNPTEAKRIGEASQKLASQLYDWRSIGDKVLKAYRSLELNSTEPIACKIEPKTKFSTNKIVKKEQVIG